MKCNQYQVDSEKFIIYLSQHASRQGACDSSEASIRGNKMQPPDLSTPPLRAAALTDDLYKKSAHVCKRKVVDFLGACPNLFCV